MYVKDEEELGKALKNNEETIEMKGNLARRICRIWNMDKLLWCLCLACLTVAVAALIASPAIGGIPAVAGFVSGTPAAAILGVPVAESAVLIAISGGSVRVLKQLRGYRMKRFDESHIVLYRGRKR